MTRNYDLEFRPKTCTAMSLKPANLRSFYYIIEPIGATKACFWAFVNGSKVYRHRKSIDTPLSTWYEADSLLANRWKAWIWGQLLSSKSILFISSKGIGRRISMAGLDKELNCRRHTSHYHVYMIVCKKKYCVLGGCNWTLMVIRQF